MVLQKRDSAQSADPPARRRRPAGALLWALTVAAAAVTLVGFVPDRWAPELIAAFRPHYAAAGAVCLAGMALTRRWAGALLAAGVVTANAAVLAPLWMGAPAPAPAGVPALTVQWHNLHGVGADRLDDVTAAVEEAGADLVIFVMVEEELKEALHHSAGLPHEIVTDPQGRVLALARVPLAGVGHLTPLPGGSRHSTITVQVPVTAERTITVLGLHAVSPRTPRRAGVRNAELAAAASWAAGQEGPALIVGDLNTPPWSRPFRDLLRAGDLRDSLRGRGLQPTWPARWGLPTVPIDHALYSSELEVVDRATGPALGGHHRSMLVTVALRRGGPLPRRTPG